MERYIDVTIRFSNQGLGNHFISGGYLFLTDGGVRLNGQIFYNRGVTFHKKGLLDEAIMDYSRAIELDQGDAEAFLNRGVAYAGKKEYEKAITDYSSALCIRQDFVEAYFNRGISYSLLNESHRAVLDFSRALGADPEFAEGRAHV
jgi:tetratricopeptide (TPR) repeat protein